MKKQDPPKFKQVTAEALQLGKKRQAMYTQFCKANKAANPKLKSCGITSAQEKELKSMMSAAQKALVAKEKGNLTKAGAAKVKSTIQGTYSGTYGKKA
tara:strand:- start:3428 stop:3721 length:294 start_codon:yes stop_codon:yes gene_type:complete